MILIIIFIIPSLSPSSLSLREIIYVDDDNVQGPWDGSLEHPFRLIQEAVNASDPGMKIFVFKGRYHEKITINKSLTLLGEKKEGTIIDAAHKGGAITIEGGMNILIQNFTIQNGSDQSPKRGYGIAIDNTESLILINNVIQSNDDGVVLQKKSEHCVIIQNTFQNNEIGFDLCTSNTNLLYENTFMNNTINLVTFNSKDNHITKNFFLTGQKNMQFFNSSDTINNNYWGREYRIYFIFGYLQFPGTDLFFPWIRCDFNPAESIDKIQKNPLAVMQTSKGMMVIELFKVKTPITSSNFINLAMSGFYENTVFHRVIDDFVIQGGGFYANGTNKKSPFGTIDLEIHPDVRHIDGAISMARTSDPNSATSQFFICDGAQPNLDDNYAAFGVIVLGFEVLRDITSVETETRYYFMQDWPIEDVFINEVLMFNQ